MKIFWERRWYDPFEITIRDGKKITDFQGGYQDQSVTSNDMILETRLRSGILSAYNLHINRHVPSLS